MLRRVKVKSHLCHLGLRHSNELANTGEAEVARVVGVFCGREQDALPPPRRDRSYLHQPVDRFGLGDVAGTPKAGSDAVVARDDGFVIGGRLQQLHYVIGAGFAEEGLGDQVFLLVKDEVVGGGFPAFHQASSLEDEELLHAIPTEGARNPQTQATCVLMWMLHRFVTPSLDV